LIINEPELVVPAGMVCPHTCAAGCAIHGPGQPASCRTYYCAYTLSARPLTAADRPDRAGAIVDRKHQPDKPPPFDRTTHVMSCAPDGLVRVLQNPTWREIILRDLRGGIPILAAQHDDPQNREVLGVRFQDHRLMCRLTSCQPNGDPILVPLEPVHATRVDITLLIPEQGFVFDAGVLTQTLGEHSHLIIGTSEGTAEASDLRFLFTQRQADWVRRLRAMLDATPAPVHEVSVATRR
jgi:hypothetical protein